MKIFEGKHCLIEDNIPRNIDPSTRDFKTFNPFVARTVADESTLGRAKRKFAFVIRSQVGPTGTTKNS
jgi:hypothetical protein